MEPRPSGGAGKVHPFPHNCGPAQGDHGWRVREFFTGRQIERVTSLRNLVHVDFASVEEARRALRRGEGQELQG